MGIADRQYVRPPASPAIARVAMLSVTTWLIIVNVAVFFADPFLFRAHVYYPLSIGPNIFLVQPLMGLGFFSVDMALYKLELWRAFTCQFIHANSTHLLMNMFSLWIFGPMIEEYLGRRRFCAFYLLCGIGGPLAYVALWLGGVLIVDPVVWLVGASAGVFGVLVAAATLAPNETVYLYGFFPAKLKTMAWVLLGIAIFTVMAYGPTGRNNAGGEAAHLGGAVVGWLLIRNPHWLKVFDFSFDFSRRRAPF